MKMFMSAPLTETAKATISPFVWRSKGGLSRRSSSSSIEIELPSTSSFRRNVGGRRANPC